MASVNRLDTKRPIGENLKPPQLPILLRLIFPRVSILVFDHAILVSLTRGKKNPPGRWPLQDAKARFSELVRRVRSDGPQHVTVHGREEVVVVAAENFAGSKVIAPVRRWSPPCKNCPTATSISNPGANGFPCVM